MQRSHRYGDQALLAGGKLAVSGLQGDAEQEQVPVFLPHGWVVL